MAPSHPGLHRRDDVARRDAVLVEQFVGFAAARNLAHGQPGDGETRGGHGARDGVADAADRIVILDRDQPAGFARGRQQRRRINRLQRVEIDHADGDALLLQLVVSLQRLVQRDAGADDGRQSASLRRRTLHPPIGNVSLLS